MIRKTVKLKKRYGLKSDNLHLNDTHSASYRITTYWFLFIPIFITEDIISSNF